MRSDLILCVCWIIVLGNKQLVSAEHEPRGWKEPDAGKVLEVQSICHEAIQRHRFGVCDCDERVAAAASAREPVEQVSQ